MPGEHAGHRQRMRERFLESGLDGFAPHEILELILFYAIPQRNVNPLAHRLLDHFGSLHGVLDAPAEDIVKVEGVGMYAATLLRLVGQAGHKADLERHSETEKLITRADVETHCRLLMAGLQKEEFYVVCLDAQKKLIRDVRVASGTLSEVQAYPRLVVETALRHNAHTVVLCHNHPSGSPVPSIDDINITRTLVSLLMGIDVVVLDHIIVAGSRTLSMVRTNLIRYHPETRELRVADSGDAAVISRTLEIAEKHGHLK